MRKIVPRSRTNRPCGTSRGHRRDGRTRRGIHPAATVAASTLLFVIAATATAQTPEEKGFAIAREAAHRDTGYHDLTAELTVVLRNRNGEERSRVMRIRRLEVDGDGDKTILIFDRPRDLQGTALLTVAHTAGSDDQWLYLPALRRVKRIASNNQSKSFMGTEFTYEDIGSQEVEKYTYRYVRDDTLEVTETFVVERYPVDPHSGYARQLVWYDQQEYRILRIDFYGRNNKLLKTLRLSGYRLYAGKYWRPEETHMVNDQTGKSTTIIWRDYRFGTGLSDRDFNRNTLARVR